MRSQGEEKDATIIALASSKEKKKEALKQQELTIATLQQSKEQKKVEIARLQEAAQKSEQVCGRRVPANCRRLMANCWRLFPHRRPPTVDGQPMTSGRLLAVVMIKWQFLYNCCFALQSLGQSLI